jgi:hypothetical protein
VEVEKLVEDQTKIQAALSESEKQLLEKLEVQKQKSEVEAHLSAREKEIKARDAAIARLNEKYKLVEVDGAPDMTPDILKPQVDNDIATMMASMKDGDVVPPATYGSKFPVDAVNGQLFTKTDLFPHKLYKWNEKKWIEVDKSGTDGYLTEDYVRTLVEKVAQGEIELEDLTDSEKGTMTDFLSNGKE